MTKNRILIIDDEADFCFFIKANLEARGPHRVKTAFSGEEGLELAVSFKPHLIILDIIMPNMDGLEVLKALKGNRSAMAIPVLMLSAKHDDYTKIEASGLYCEGYVTKPVSVDELLARIERILELRRLA
jgi:DNA-binding response OmpR family regulator